MSNIQFKQNNCQHGSAILSSQPNHGAFILCQIRMTTELLGKPSETLSGLLLDFPDSRILSGNDKDFSAFMEFQYSFVYKRGRKTGKKLTFLFDIPASIEQENYLRIIIATNSGSLSQICLL